MKEKFTGCYQVTKTLRFALRPVGKTLDTFNQNLMLEKDEKRAESYQKVKEYMDRYHKFFIEDVLSNLVLNGIDEYAEIYYKSNKTDPEKTKMKKLEEDLRKQISDVFTKDSRYPLLFKKDFLEEILPAFLIEKEEQETLSEFDNFATYFYGFFENRENMYSKDEKATAISFRCINQNLPMFLDNIKSFERIKSVLSEDLKKIDDNYKGIFLTTVFDAFTFDYFSLVLTQSGIDHYNQLIGGFSTEDGIKVKGINEYINLHNQKADRSQKLPLLKNLYKQILSDRESMSFIPDQFKSDDDMLSSLQTYLEDETIHLKASISTLVELMKDLKTYDLNGIYVSAGAAVTDLAKSVFGNWNAIRENWERSYEENNPLRSGTSREKYLEKQAKAYKAFKSFSLSMLQRLGNECGTEIVDYYAEAAQIAAETIGVSYKAVEQYLAVPYRGEKRFAADDLAVESIKNFLDSIKKMEWLAKPLLGTGMEESKDNSFYAEFLPAYDSLRTIDNIYNKIRNYLTQKPYSNDKIKLNFDCSSFLSGWAKSYDTKGGLLVQKDSNYYLVIVDKKLDQETCDYLKTQYEEDPADRIVYDAQKADMKNVPRLLICSKKDRFAPAVSDFNLPVQDILELYNNRWFKKEYRKKDPEKYKESLTKLIDYFKLGIPQHESFCQYSFDNCWKPSSEYKDISEFYKDTQDACYQIAKEKINFSHLLELAAQGKVYIFQIYNKDFSAYSKGTPNLHTMYFRMLFDERNLKDVVYKLNGQAEMFYRKASIAKKERVVHPANQAIKNKNPLNEKQESTFAYDLVKDKRYTVDQFQLHVPITMNYKATGNGQINKDVRCELKNSDHNYVIGIDRGERNLIYVSVINEKSEIVEQYSLNEIISGANHRVDYQGLLHEKEKDRDQARKNWKQIGTIKELKEGYISQVVHKICELVVKYDAVVAMEDLNSGFMNSRKKVEKQVYQKFETMLTEKMNYLVDKCLAADQEGGLLKAYQLTNKANKLRNGNQDGIIFYVPAWLTSKIDPTTGFVSLLKTRYTSIEAAQEFFSLFDDIRYNLAEDLFEFDIDYRKFPKGSVDSRGKWTICSYGERIRTFRNPEKNQEWDNETIHLTKAFKTLFNCYGVDYSRDLKQQICTLGVKDFYFELLHLLALTLQMRNSITGNTEIDYLISPVKNASGKFFDSREKDAALPLDADANGAYNIARKGLWAINQIKASDDIEKLKISISNKEWLRFAQNIEH